MRRLFKFLLAANSIMIMAVIYLIKESNWICNYKGLSIVLYIIIPVVFAGGCLLLSNGLPTDSADGGFSNVELANDNYMPSYLGYFFVALSIGVKRDNYTIPEYKDAMLGSNTLLRSSKINGGHVL